MEELITILLILFSAFAYGAMGGYLAAKYDKTFENIITEGLHVIKWIYCWPIMLIRRKK